MKMTKYRKQVVIFDIDGTLINSDPVVVSILNKIRENKALQPMPMSFYSPYLATGGLYLIEKTVTGTKNKIINQKYLNVLRESYLDVKPDESILYPNVRKSLENLQSLNLDLCICTNKSRKLVDKILSELKLLDKFSGITADGDLSTRKPNVKNLDASVAHLNVHKNNMIFIGDSFVDKQISSNKGIEFLAYCNGENQNFIKNNELDFFDDYAELADKILRY